MIFAFAALAVLAAVACAAFVLWVDHRVRHEPGFGGGLGDDWLIGLSPFADHSADILLGVAAGLTLAGALA